MFATDHPAWAEYKAHLSRIAEAGARLTEAQAENDLLEIAQAEQEFLAALAAYDRVRESLASAAPAGLDGIVLPFMRHPKPPKGHRSAESPHQPGLMRSLREAPGDCEPRQMQQGGGDQDA